MVVAKIEEICSRDRIRVVRLPCGHITDKKKDVGKRRHHYTNSRETLLITEQVAYDEKDLIL